MLVYLYYILMVMCFIASLYYLHFFKVKMLSLLLFLSICTEAWAEIIGTHQFHHFILYHYFNIAEYALTTIILLSGIDNIFLKRLMIFSIPCYTLISLYISLMVQGINEFPSINCNIESLLIIVWCIISLWNIKPDYKFTMFQKPTFWFILGFFIYFSGTMTFDGIYNTLLSHKTETATKLFSIINSVCNYLLYILLLIGIACYRFQKKYMSQ